jgi:hypothetical protein
MNVAIPSFHPRSLRIGRFNNQQLVSETFAQHISIGVRRHVYECRSLIPQLVVGRRRKVSGDTYMMIGLVMGMTFIINCPKPTNVPPAIAVAHTQARISQREQAGRYIFTIRALDDLGQACMHEVAHFAHTYKTS